MFAVKIRNIAVISNKRKKIITNSMSSNSFIKSIKFSAYNKKIDANF